MEEVIHFMQDSKDCSRRHTEKYVIKSYLLSNDWYCCSYL